LSTITVRRCTSLELEQSPALSRLLAEYGEESGIPALGPQNPQFLTYQAMESAGISFAFGAFNDEGLVGFLIILVAVLPHFGRKVASSESFFVSPAAREGGTGLRLLHLAEEFAQEQGAAGLFVSAHTGGRLEQVLPRLAYNETSRVFFKAFT